ncbi:MAG: hypothetical protein ACTSPS_14490 [Promethearchaeota archaeon]
MELEEPKEREKEKEEEEEEIDIDQIIDKLKGLEDLKYMNSMFGTFNYIGRHARAPIYLNHF